MNTRFLERELADVQINAQCYCAIAYSTYTYTVYHSSPSKINE